jgi:hypothetical protein
MTVNIEIPSVSYSGNDATTNFPFVWSSAAESENIVNINGVEQLEGVGYELINYTEDFGGEILIEPAPSGTDRIVIFRRTPVTQQIDYVESAAFPANSHEFQMDKDTRILQEIIESGRAAGGLPIDLESLERPYEVEIDNTGGANAFIPLWNCDDQLAGVFAGEVTTSAPADGTPDSNQDGYIYWEIAP